MVKLRLLADSSNVAFFSILPSPTTTARGATTEALAAAENYIAHLWGQTGAS